MLPSVRAFLSGIIDYAGLFPPAKLPLDRAIGNYADYRAGRDAWMLGRFVIPAARLGELDPHVRLFSPRSPLVLSVLGRGGEAVEPFLAGMADDLQAVSAFRDHHGGAVVVDAYEVKLPPNMFLNPAAEGLQSRLSGMSVFCETQPTRGISFFAFAALRGTTAGVKLRCGGLEASAFPEPAQVAHAIAACRDNGLSLKFTAGLHHPIRHFDRDLGTKMHGFLNVFGAGVLTHALRLDEGQVRQIIEDEEPSHFVFDEQGFGWKQDHALTDDILAARRQFVVSFGSCSFDEPRDDLRALAILT
jgi:hypothetical protein